MKYLIEYFNGEGWQRWFTTQFSFISEAAAAVRVLVSQLSCPMRIVEEFGRPIMYFYPGPMMRLEQQQRLSWLRYGF